MKKICHLHMQKERRRSAQLINVSPPFLPLKILQSILYFKPEAIFDDRKARFMSGLVGNPGDRCSHVHNERNFSSYACIRDSRLVNVSRALTVTYQKHSFDRDKSRIKQFQ